MPHVRRVFVSNCRLRFIFPVVGAILHRMPEMHASNECMCSIACDVPTTPVQSLPGGVQRQEAAMSKSIKCPSSVKAQASIKNQAIAGTCVSLVGLFAVTTGAFAQGTAPSPGPAQSASARPPVARQIEPMVAPVRRSAPKQMASPNYVVPPASAQGLVQAAAPVATAVAPKGATTPVAQAQAQAQPQAQPQGQAAIPAATSPITTKSTLTPVQATAQAQAKATPPTKTQKIVVHTCKLGQDYSEKLKSCFTPGVTARAATKVANAAKSARNRFGASIESVTRSALGAKRKP